jgi:hypothetical protein
VNLAKPQTILEVEWRSLKNDSYQGIASAVPPERKKSQRL